MSKEITPARLREQDIMNRASRVMAFTVDAQRTQDGTLITDRHALSANIGAALKNDPMFEGVEPEFGRVVGTAWASSMIDYHKRHGCYPPADQLANASRALENLLTESASAKHEGSGKAMFESVAADMRTSDGVMRQAQFAALILPAVLGAATSDACTFVPCERDEAKVYELLNVAGTTFGSFQQGDEMNMQSAAVYSQMKRHYVFPAASQPDGTKKTFAFSLKAIEGVDMPIRAGRSKLLINRRPSKVDDGDGNLYFQDKDFNGNAFAATCKVDYDKGTIAVTFQDAPVKGTELSAQVEINVEKAPNLIPVINQSMREFTIKPSQFVIASEHTVMAASDLSREFGINLNTTQFTAMRNWLSHEQDMMRLRTMAFHTVYGRKFDVALPEGQTYESWVGLMKHVITQLSTDMVNRTRKAGIRGGFAGSEAANFLKSLPSNVFQADPNFVQSPYIQRIGTLFGIYQIYEVPAAVCEQFVASGAALGKDDILFYGRGDSIGDAGLIAGDAVPAIPYVHETNPSLVNRTTLWGSSLNELHPRNGENYFAKLTLTNAKVGAYNMLTGQKIEGEAAPEATTGTTNATS
ncbi:capsid protein [Enterobacter sp. BRE11]|nr:capsid protein [Enterobacter sp. BRE11]